DRPLVPQQLAALPARGHFPEADFFLVLPAPQEGAPVGRESDAVQRVAVSHKAAHLRAGRHVPDTDQRPLPALPRVGRGTQVSVRRDGPRGYRALARRELAHLLTCRNVPAANLAVVPPTRDQSPAVRAEHARPCVSKLTQQAAGGCLPEAHVLLPPAGRR